MAISERRVYTAMYVTTNTPNIASTKLTLVSTRITDNPLS